MLTNAVEKFDSSARRYDRIIKLSKTIADHTESEKKAPADIAEALQYRCLDRRNWRD